MIHQIAAFSPRPSAEIQLKLGSGMPICVANASKDPQKMPWSHDFYGFGWFFGMFKALEGCEGRDNSMAMLPEAPVTMIALMAMPATSFFSCTLQHSGPNIMARFAARPLLMANKAQSPMRPTSEPHSPEVSGDRWPNMKSGTKAKRKSTSAHRREGPRQRPTGPAIVRPSTSPT